MVLEQLFEEYMRYPNFSNIALDDVNMMGHFKQSPLHLAASRGETNEINLLLDNGAKIDIIGELGSTPLHIACLRGNYNAVKLLIDRGANITLKEDDGSSLFDIASSMFEVDSSANREKVLNLFS